jgi:hypothetical protein
MPPINIENPTGNPSGYWGRTPQEIAHAFTTEGYNAQVLPAKPGTSGLATRIKITGKSNTGQKPPVDVILIHPGGGVHGAARYIKFSSSSQKGATKLVEYAEYSTAYKVAGEKNATIILRGFNGVYGISNVIMFEEDDTDDLYDE